MKSKAIVVSFLIAVGLLMFGVYVSSSTSRLRAQMEREAPVGLGLQVREVPGARLHNELARVDAAARDVLGVEPGYVSVGLQSRLLLRRLNMRWTGRAMSMSWARWMACRNSA